MILAVTGVDQQMIDNQCNQDDAAIPMRRYIAASAPEEEQQSKNKWYQLHPPSVIRPARDTAKGTIGQNDDQRIFASL